MDESCSRRDAGLGPWGTAPLSSCLWLSLGAPCASLSLSVEWVFCALGDSCRKQMVQLLQTGDRGNTTQRIYSRLGPLDFLSL